MAMESREAKKILLVDDERDTVEMITTLLELEGYRVFSASSGEKAMDFLEGERQKVSDSETPVDLILLDVMLGDADREDLYYRLNVLPIFVPPLRERKDDISLLASHFLKKFTQEKGREAGSFSPEVMEIFLAHSWPGNVREIENVIEHAVIIAKGEKILPKDLPQYLLQKPLPEQELVSLEDYEKSIILKTLEETNWNKHQTAKKLKINRSTLYGKMRRYELIKE